MKDLSTDCVLKGLQLCSSCTARGESQCCIDKKFKWTALEHKCAACLILLPGTWVLLFWDTACANAVSQPVRLNSNIQSAVVGLPRTELLPLTDATPHFSAEVLAKMEVA